MSRIGRLPVVVPAGVTVEVKENNYVVVKGSKGTLERNLPVEMDIKVEDGHVVVTRPPPTCSFLASLSVITPWFVDRIAIPSPPSTLGSSSLPA